MLGQCLGDDKAGAGIVAAVEPDVGAGRPEVDQPPLRQLLHPSGPGDCFHSLVGRPLPDIEAGRLDRGDRRRGVGELVPAGQARQRQVHQPVLVLVDHAPVLAEGQEILAVYGDGRTQALGRIGDHGKRGVEFLLADHGRAARLEDTGFLGRDQLDPVAEIGFMVERDRHDDRDSGPPDDIGGIETPAQSHLDDGGVGRMLRKQHEADRRQDLEDRDRLALIGVGHASDRVSEHRVLHQPAAAGRAQPVAFVPVDEMRRGVHVNAVSRRLQQRAREGRAGPLAVCAGDVDDRRQSVLRIAELLEQARDAVERKVEALRMQRHQALDLTVGGKKSHGSFSGKTPSDLEGLHHSQGSDTIASGIQSVIQPRFRNGSPIRDGSLRSRRFPG